MPMFPRETMVREHLRHNCYPPIGMGDDGAVRFALAALDAINEGDPQRLIEVDFDRTLGKPNPDYPDFGAGSERTGYRGVASLVVEDWHLQGFLAEENSQL